MQFRHPYSRLLPDLGRLAQEAEELRLAADQADAKHVAAELVDVLFYAVRAFDGRTVSKLLDIALSRQDVPKAAKATRDCQVALTLLELGYLPSPGGEC